MLMEKYHVYSGVTGLVGSSGSDQATSSRLRNPNSPLYLSDIENRIFTFSINDAKMSYTLSTYLKTMFSSMPRPGQEYRLLLEWVIVTKY